MWTNRGRFKQVFRKWHYVRMPENEALCFHGRLLTNDETKRIDTAPKDGSACSACLRSLESVARYKAQSA